MPGRENEILYQFFRLETRLTFLFLHLKNECRRKSDNALVILLQRKEFRSQTTIVLTTRTLVYNGSFFYVISFTSERNFHFVENTTALERCRFIPLCNCQNKSCFSYLEILLFYLPNNFKSISDGICDN